jgi:hypothetical protein
MLERGVSVTTHPVFEPEAALEAFDDIVYVTDLDGIVVFLKAGPWRDFAAENGGDEIASASRVLGRPLESFLSGDSVCEQFRTLFEQVRSGARTRISYPFRCDAPDRVRFMRLTMSAIPGADGSPAAVLFHSALLDEKHRATQQIIDGQAHATAMQLPIQSICAYCKRLELPSHSGRWLEAEQYTASGGETDVRLSHGVCPDCAATVLARLAEAD